MVAELKANRSAPPLPLLFEPDRPRSHGRADIGWTRTRRISGRLARVELHRRHEDDTRGAEIQHAIVRYVLGQSARADLAVELCVGQTQVQYYLRGAAWGAYGRPVLRALRRLGITTGRGDWSVGSRRSRELIAAGRLLMHEAADVLDGADLTPTRKQRLVAELRLLSVGIEGRP